MIQQIVTHIFIITYMLNIQTKARSNRKKKGSDARPRRSSRRGKGNINIKIVELHSRMCMFTISEKGSQSH